VLCVVGALAAAFAWCTTLLVRREERRGIEPGSQRTRASRVHEPSAVRPRPTKAPQLRAAKQPRPRASKAAHVRTAHTPRKAVAAESSVAVSEPDPRRPSLVDNLDAFTQIERTAPRQLS